MLAVIVFRSEKHHAQARYTSRENVQGACNSKLQRWEKLRSEAATAAEEGRALAHNLSIQLPPRISLLHKRPGKGKEWNVGPSKRHPPRLPRAIIEPKSTHPRP